MVDITKNKILVIGDSCQDIFIYGKVERLCPDAPVPILIPQKTTQTGGMAANVYENIVSLGYPVDIITNKKVVTKTRYVEEHTNQMIVRIDSEKTLISRIDNLKSINFSEYSAIIISDYNKGFLEYEDIEYICNSHPVVFVDTKKVINKYFSKARFIKINNFEVSNNLAAGQTLEEFKDKLITTLGHRGCEYRGKIYPVEKVEIRDMSGAGDTFIAALAIEYSISQDIEKAIEYANLCATVAVQHKGVTKVGNHLPKINI